MFKLFVHKFLYMFGNRLEYDKIAKYTGKKGCPFCINDGKEKKYIIMETKYWSIRYNKFPYYGEKKHLMAIPIKHKKFTNELSKEELKDYKNIELFMKNYYIGEDNYFSFIRQGIGGRSVEHLHYHYLPGHISFDKKSGNLRFNIKNKQGKS